MNSCPHCESQSEHRRISIEVLRLVYYECRNCKRFFPRPIKNPNVPNLFQQFQEEVESYGFNILVFGPGRSNPLFRKRHEIQEMLIAEGHNARMGEELTATNTPFPSDIQEFFQVNQFDYVILLEGSAGSLTEMIEFGIDYYRDRFLTFFPKAGRRSYPGTGTVVRGKRLGALIVEYTDVFVEKCLMKLIVQDMVKFWQSYQFTVDIKLRFWEQQQRGFRK